VLSLPPPGGIAIRCVWCVCWFVCSFVNTFWGQISRKWLKMEARFHWTTDRKWHMANQMVTWPMTLRHPLLADVVARTWWRLRSVTAYSSFGMLRLFLLSQQSIWDRCMQTISLSPLRCPLDKYNYFGYLHLLNWVFRNNNMPKPVPK